MLVSAVVAVSGCRTLGFYAQALKGQYQIVAHQERIDRLVADSKTPERLKARLKFLEELRSFAKKELKLPVDGHYQKYADVHRPYVVWNVEAAPELSTKPKTWWYPLVGSLEYRGYFSKSGATNYAGYLRRKGYDVYVGAVQAYSTLGWFKDPVLNTFIFEPDAELAEIIFHELGHQRVFAHGDTDFNEAFATTVGQEGARRWLMAKGDKAALGEYLASLRRNDQFVHLVMKAHARLEALYGDTRTEDGKVKSTDRKRAVTVETLRRGKEKVFEDLKHDLASLKVQWGGNDEYDGWLDRQLNNADLNSVAAYYDLVPGFERLLALNGNDLEKFYSAADRLAHMPKKERKEWLKTLAK